MNKSLVVAALVAGSFAAQPEDQKLTLADFVDVNMVLAEEYGNALTEDLN